MVTYAQYYGIVDSQPAPPGLCNVIFRLLDGSGNPIEGCKIMADMNRKDSQTSSQLLSKSTLRATTNSDGEAGLILIQRSQFTRGGVYRIRVFGPDGSRVDFDRKVFCPDLNTCEAPQLIDAIQDN